MWWFRAYLNISAGGGWLSIEVFALLENVRFIVFCADFMIFRGVWFCCFSTSTDVRFCLTRFSIRTFALPENGVSWWCRAHFIFSRALAVLFKTLSEFYHRPISPG